MLIETLAHDVRPVPRRAVERRMAGALATGGLVAVAIIPMTIGLRDDLAAALAGGTFWMKLIYTLALALGGTAAAIGLARPDAPGPRGLWLLSVPVLLMAGLSAHELLTTPATEWMALVKGESWDRCALNILFLALPIFVAGLWAFRRFAPTRLRLTGAMAGLAAGGLSATLYGLHCPEASATFVLLWYSLGIAVATLGGWLTGPRLLRW